ncbi:hypothetical protein LC608_07530 [Nostoc sp. XA010]|uniref:hypothetical protein n=1 Tax=Nostoc sp. XA010 TaxID=2780407 RepID=UPI001E3403C5|nr:hypothetical protein [Nostoc sp. XA010]MCC5656840.1 hypothetical protein [Nostoc sp. XA010]
MLLKAHIFYIITETFGWKSKQILPTASLTVTGTRATATKYGFDRYWRDLRTFTLHDPVDYKLRAIGDWVLNEQLPVITQYS